MMAKKPLDLYRFFKLVVERGGIVEVIKRKAWKKVAKELNLPASFTAASYKMRTQYVKYLYPYECEVVKLSNPNELQAAINRNKHQPIYLHTGEKEVNFPTIPHASGSSDSSSVIVAMPTGQVVEVPGMLMMVKGPQPQSHLVSEDGEDDNSSPREPPTKKIALEAEVPVMKYTN